MCYQKLITIFPGQNTTRFAKPSSKITIDGVKALPSPESIENNACVTKINIISETPLHVEITQTPNGYKFKFSTLYNF